MPRAASALFSRPTVVMWVCIAVQSAGCEPAAAPPPQRVESEYSAGSEGPALAALPPINRGSSADTAGTHQGLLIARATLDEAMPEPPADRSYASLQRWVDTEVVAWVERRRAKTQEARERFSLEGDPNASVVAISHAVVGLIHEDTARSLRNIPSPSELESEPEIAEMYRDIVAAQADTFLNSALVEFRDCANDAYNGKDDMRPFALFCHGRFDELQTLLSSHRKATGVASAGDQ